MITSSRASSGASVAIVVVDDGGRHHQPDGARPLQLLDQLLEGGRADGPFADERLNLLGKPIEGDDLVARLDQS